MRTTLIALLIVVAAAIALCAFAQSRVCGLVEEMDELRLLAERELRAGNEAAAMELRAQLMEAIPGSKEVYVDCLSLSVSCHIGPGALAVAFSRNID